MAVITLMSVAMVAYECADWVILNALIWSALAVATYRLQAIYNLQHDFINDKQAIEEFDKQKDKEHYLLGAMVIILFFCEETILGLTFAALAVAKFTVHVLGMNKMQKGDMYKKGYLTNYKSFSEVNFFFYFCIVWIFVFRLLREFIDEVYHKRSTRWLVAK
jgi:hypothetical protein